MALGEQDSQLRSSKFASRYLRKSPHSPSKTKLDYMGELRSVIETLKKDLKDKE